MHKLIIQDDEGKTTVVPLIRDEITIGRKEGNTIRLTERNVSRRHARIVKSNGTVVVEDLDSYNGVKVNGTRIQGRVNVNESDRIQIGDYLLELKVERGAGDTTSPGSSGTFTPGASPSAQPPPVPLSMQPTPMMGHPMGAPMGQPGAAPMGGGMGPNNGAAARQQAAQKNTAPMPAFPADGPVAMGTPAPEVLERAAGAAAESPGRLCIVSSNFGGREFILDKPVMVIGRTDDNDVVVNHRSISRHHAKIVLEQGRYCIVDMQSSNGVRVNGEDYGKVELRRGDMIDLGHVRLRYVEPGEDFVFDRDAQLVDIAVRGGKGKGALIAAMSLVAVGAVVAVVFVTQRGSGEAVATAPPPTAPIASTATPPEPTAAHPTETHPPVAAAEPKPPKPTAALVATTPADAGGTAATPTPPPTDKPPTEKSPETAPDPNADVNRLLGDAREAVAAEKWISALGAVEQVLKSDPANAEAKKIQEQANAEFRNHSTYQNLVKARDNNKAADVAKLAKEIPFDSIYKAKAAADLEKMHDQYIREREADARTYSSKGQCDKIAPLARRAAEVFPDARAAVEKAGAGCVQAVAARPPEPTATEKPTAPSAAPTDAELGALVSEAREEARNGNWAEARKKADDVLRHRPTDQDALSVAGIAACNLLDKDRAMKYIDRLKGNRQTMMKQICATKGLTIE